MKTSDLLLVGLGAVGIGAAVLLSGFVSSPGSAATSSGTSGTGTTKQPTPKPSQVTIYEEGLVPSDITGSPPLHVSSVSGNVFSDVGTTDLERLAGQQAYDYYREMLEQYNLNWQAYAAAGKKPPAFSFQTPDFIVVLNSITDAVAFVYDNPYF